MGYRRIRVQSSIVPFVEQGFWFPGEGGEAIVPPHFVQLRGGNRNVSPKPVWPVYGTKLCEFDRHCLSFSSKIPERFGYVSNIHDIPDHYNYCHNHKAQHANCTNIGSSATRTPNCYCSSKADCPLISRRPSSQGRRPSCVVLLGLSVATDLFSERVSPHEWQSHGDEVQGLGLLREEPPAAKLNSRARLMDPTIWTISFLSAHSLAPPSICTCPSSI